MLWLKYTSQEMSQSRITLMCQLLRLQAVPGVYIESFVNMLNYHYFMAFFREGWTNVEDSQGKLRSLIKYLSGDAAELINHCIQLPKKWEF